MVYEETIKLNDGVSGPATSASKSMSSLAKQTENAQQAASKQSGIMSLLGGKLSDAAGMNTEMAAATGGLSVALELGTKAAAGLVAVLGALAIAGAYMAIEASQAKESMISMFDALGAGVTTGEEIDEMLDNMRDKLGITKDAMVPLVKEFLSMGVTGKESIEKLTTAALSAKALMGGAESAAQAFVSLQKKIQLAAETGQALKIPLKGLGSLSEMGLTVNDVAKKMGVSTEDLTSQLKNGTVNAVKFGNALSEAVTEKGKGPLDKMASSLSNIGGMLKEYIGDMFEDMQGPVNEFMSALKDAFSVFSTAKPSGEAMKTGIQAAITEILRVATKLVPIMKNLFLDMIILGLKAYIALKPTIKWFKDLMANEAFIKKLSGAFEVFKVVLIAVGVVIGIVAALFLLLVALPIAMVTGIYILIGAIIDFVGGAGKALWDWVASAVNIGISFVQGIVNGITSGVGMVVDAAKNLGASALGAIKGVLGIASPSKVMLDMGGHTATGFAEGMAGGAPEIHEASSGMAKTAKIGAEGESSKAGKSSGSNTITVMVNIDGAGKSALEITEELVAATFERMALTAGV